MGTHADTWYYVVEEGKVGVAHHTLVIPYYRLCSVGTEACDVVGSGGDTVVADGGGDVTAAEEESLDLSRGSKGDVGEVVTIVEGGVRDE